MSKRRVLISVSVLALAASCFLGLVSGCDPSLVSVGNGGCISADDVLAIPPGSAMATDLSGQYEIVSGFLKSCEPCGQNTVADPCAGQSVIVDEGFVGTITQGNGVLTFGAQGEELVGGLDDDNSFSVGTISSVTDVQGEIVGQALVLFEGRFVDNRILVEAVFRFTTNEGIEVRDFVFTNEVVYERLN